MPPLQFRAWGPWGDWLDDGGVINDPRCEAHGREYTMLHSDTLAFEEYAPIGELLNQAHFDVTQATGLTDKYGTAIYAGDFVDNGKHIFAVYWREECAGFEFHCIEDPEFSWMPNVDGVAYRFEVIGNRFEHPELLSEDA